MPDSPPSHHPGSGCRRPAAFPKGRAVDDDALTEVRALLGKEALRRDLLIEYLHGIQDRYGHLSAAHLAALAEAMGLSQVEVYEVASFYAHFDVVREGAVAPPPVTVRVCEGLTCVQHGAERLRAGLAAAVDPGRVRVLGAPCLGRCDRAPAVSVTRAGLDGVRHRAVEAATVESVLAAVAAAPPAPPVPPAVAAGDGRLLRDCLEGRRSPESVMAALDGAGLRGLGGAGFPVGRKWRMVRGQPAPRLMAVNADEGEPGTFKDRHYLESEPLQVLEGMLVAAWAVEATDIYIYVRDEYAAIRERLAAILTRLSAEGLDQGRRIHLRRGAGAYVCGEESAMLESIEGRRGLPRHKPPYPAESGLWGRPTLVQNVETLYWVRPIVEGGADRFAAHGRRDRHGLRSFSVSGRVREPGVKLAPAGITAAELIAEHCGGMAPGHRFAAYLPGGASGGILPAALADRPLDFGTLEAHGAFIGSAAVIVLSDQDDLRAVARNLARFFADESCGQCTPCRVGTEKLAELLEAPSWNAALLDDLGRAMADASICGLGQAAPNAVRTLLRHFSDRLT